MGLYDDDDDITSEITQPSNSSRSDDEPPTKKRFVELDGQSEEQLLEAADTQKNKDEPEVFSVREHALLAVVAAKKGERDEMQDAHLLDSNFCLHKKFLRRTCLYGIFDGHGGLRAAKHCEEMLQDRLMTKLSSFADQSSMEKGLKKTITQVYKKLDDTFLAEARKEKPVWKDGTTATTVLVLNDSIFVANIGDSKAIVARFKEGAAPVPIVLTVEHNPTMYEERMRIQATGATVVNGRVNGILEVSRSIGDGQFKTYGVTCVPDMRKCTITGEDKYVLTI